METDFLDDSDNDPIINLMIEVQHRFAIDGNVSIGRIMDFRNGIEDKDLIFLPIDVKYKSILAEFDLEHITHYVATKSIYEERLAIIEKACLLEQKEVLLILLSKSIWGIHTEITESTQADWSKTKHKSLRDKSKIEQINRIHNYLSKEDVFRYEMKHYDRSDLQNVPLLKRVKFEFIFNNSSEKESIRIDWPEDNLNAIGYIILNSLNNRRFFERLTEEYNITRRSSKWYTMNQKEPHLLFCYRFVSFLQNHTPLHTPLISKNEQFRIYAELLKSANYKINTSNTDFYQEEANLRGWYNSGKKICRKLELKF